MLYVTDDNYNPDKLPNLIVLRVLGVQVWLSCGRTARLMQL